MAVDGSEESMHALDWSLRNVLSANAQNTVVLLYARPPPAFYPSDTSGEPSPPSSRFSHKSLIEVETLPREMRTIDPTDFPSFRSAAW